jgi:hypothetical protein
MVNLSYPDYKPIVEYLKQKHNVDFIFEEASGYGPSAASDITAGRYLDIDSDTTAMLYHTHQKTAIPLSQERDNSTCEKFL